MEYREQKGFNLSVVGIGCYGLSGVYGQKDTKSYQDVIVRAWEDGVNFFDTAEAYGDAERILGEAIQPFRQDIYIATKVSPKKGGKPDLSRANILAACEKSLKTLGTDVIDLYQVHFDDPIVPADEVVSVLEELVKQGKIRKYGLGHLPLEKVSQYFEAGDIFSVMMELSPAERGSLNHLLPACRKHGVGGLAFSVTGRGLLSGKYGPETSFEEGDIRRIDPLFQRERFSTGLKIANKLSEVGKRYGKTPVQAAIAWVLAQPGVLTALTGPSRAEHLEENLGGCGWTFSDEDWSELGVFLDHQQSELEAAQRRSIRSILSGELAEQPAAAFTDLVYAMENAIGLGLLREEQVMPLFYELIGLRKSLGESETGRALVDIQGRLRELVAG
jgi:aryl-alcohol dehydrogenase-like predicted oxidoreductase